MLTEQLTISFVADRKCSTKAQLSAVHNGATEGTSKERRSYSLGRKGTSVKLYFVLFLFLVLVSLCTGPCEAS